MGFFSTLVKGVKTKTLASKLSNGTKKPTVVTGSSASKAIMAGVTAGAKAAAKSYQKPKSSSNASNNSGSKSSGNQRQTTAPAPTANSPVPAQQNDTGTGDLIRWSGEGGISFFVKPTQINGLKDISISAEPDTEDKESDGEKVVSLKNKGKITVTLTGILMASLGADVENMSMHIVDASRRGEIGYLYLAGKKMFSSQMMLTKAEAKGILFTSDGRWIQSEVTMTLTQCSKSEGSTGGSSDGGSSGGGTSYKYSVKVYYSGSSGAMKYVVGYSNVSQDDAKKKAWAKVPKNALWASETPKQATGGSAGTSSGTGKKTVQATGKAKARSIEVYKASKRGQRTESEK